MLKSTKTSLPFKDACHHPTVKDPKPLSAILLASAASGTLLLDHAAPQGDDMKRDKSAKRGSSTSYYNLRMRS